MKFLEKIRKWPIEKKRIFSISIAIFFTILVIILNSGINIIWKDETKNTAFDKNNPINLLQDSISKIYNEAKPVLDQVFGSSTNDSSSQTDKIVDQTNSTSSSFSTTSNIVE